MNIHKLAILILFGSTALVSATQTAQAKGASSSGGRSSSSFSSSRSYSTPKTFTRTSSAKPIYQNRNISPKPAKSSNKAVYRSSGGEYEYFALNDCKRIVKPINGYRCFDRD